MIKRIRIAQAEGPGWRKEIRKYVAKYRGIDHATTGKSPAKMLFNREVRGKLLEVYSNHHQDLEVGDRDAELKAKTSLYVDEPRNAQPSETEIQVGDQVLMRQDITNKLSTQFQPTPHLKKGRATTMSGEVTVIIQ